MSARARVCSNWRDAAPRRTPGGTSSTRTFLGDPVSAVLAQGDYRPCRARSRTFRRETVAPRRRCRVARACRPGLSAEAGRRWRRPASVVARQDLGHRAGRRSGPAVGRHDAGRAVPLRRWRRDLGAERDAVAHAGAPAMVRRRRRRAARHQLGAGRSARSLRHPGRGFDRRLVGEPRRRRIVADHQSRHVQRIHAAGAARDADRAGHPPAGALRRASRHRLVPASQRACSAPRMPARAGTS